MANKGSKFFSVMVIGDNPTDLMKKYDIGLKVKPYIKYKYLDASKMQNNAIKVYSEITSNPGKFMLNKFQEDYFKDKLKGITSMTPFEYYSTITNGLYYDENGNALSDENPDGKWSTYHIGRNFSYPMITNDGKETYQEFARNVNWGLMHMEDNSVRLYGRVWDLAVEDDEPKNDDEKQIKAQWKDRGKYLSNFKSKDDFITHNCAYWNYAYLDENGWHDVDSDENGNENEWIKSFYSKFIKKINDDALITIYEFSRNVDDGND